MWNYQSMSWYSPPFEAEWLFDMVRCATQHFWLAAVPHHGAGPSAELNWSLKATERREFYVNHVECFDSSSARNSIGSISNCSKVLSFCNVDQGSTLFFSLVTPWCRSRPGNGLFSCTKSGQMLHLDNALCYIYIWYKARIGKVYYIYYILYILYILYIILYIYIYYVRCNVIQVAYGVFNEN